MHLFYVKQFVCYMVHHMYHPNTISQWVAINILQYQILN